MNLKQYISELRARLHGLAPEEEINLATYIKEIVEDKMEEGMTEEEAVATLEDPESAARRILEESGISAGSDAGEKAGSPDTFEEYGLDLGDDQDKDEEDDPEEDEDDDLENRPETFVRKAEDLSGIEIDAECKKVTLVSADTDDVTFEFCPAEGETFDFNDETGRLVLTHRMLKKTTFSVDSIIEGVSKLIRNLGNLSNMPGFPFFSDSRPEQEIRVTVPRYFDGDVIVKTTMASVSAQELNCGGNVTLRTSSAQIRAESVTCGGAFVSSTSNAKVRYAGIRAGEISVSSSNGKIVMKDSSSSGGLSASTSNASIMTEDLHSSGRMKFATSNASVILGEVFSPSILISTSNASILGTVAGRAEDYRISLATSVAKCSPANKSSGIYDLKATTSNSSIDIKFTK